jgi:hypothetical protein
MEELMFAPATALAQAIRVEDLALALAIIAGPDWREDVALAAAQQIETALGGWQRPAM